MRPTANEAIICVAFKNADDVLFLNVGDCGYRTLSCRMDSKIISLEHKSNIRSGPQILLPKETTKADQYYQLWVEKLRFLEYEYQFETCNSICRIFRPKYYY